MWPWGPASLPSPPSSHPSVQGSRALLKNLFPTKNFPEEHWTHSILMTTMRGAIDQTLCQALPLQQP